jgi:GNAT superfamily N-acetyltransferase
MKSVDPDESEIDEQAIARYSDFQLDLPGLNISNTVVHLQWILVKHLKIDNVNLEIRKLKTNKNYIVGRWDTADDELKFIRVAEIKLREERISNKNYHSVDLVRVMPEYRGGGISTELYRTLVKIEKINLLSDTEQYFGARKLWSKLSRQPDLIVDLINSGDGSIIERNVKLHHGIEDYDFDERVWDYTDIKKHVRLVLKDIK